jgi:hypothetical protein
MRGSPAFATLFAAAIAIAPCTSGAAGSSTTSGSSMTEHAQHLLGRWNCNASLPATSDHPAQTDHGIMTFSMTPNNMVHSHIDAAGCENDEYYGYDSKTRVHWANAVDMEGVVTWETSNDGVVYTGASRQAGATTPTRDTFTQPKPEEIRDLTELQMNGKWTVFSDVVCTKI